MIHRPPEKQQPYTPTHLSPSNDQDGQDRSNAGYPQKQKPYYTNISRQQSKDKAQKTTRDPVRPTPSLPLRQWGRLSQPLPIATPPLFLRKRIRPHRAAATARLRRNRPRGRRGTNPVGGHPPPSASFSLETPCLGRRAAIQRCRAWGSSSSRGVSLLGKVVIAIPKVPLDRGHFGVERCGAGRVVAAGGGGLRGGDSCGGGRREGRGFCSLVRGV